MKLFVKNITMRGFKEFMYKYPFYHKCRDFLYYRFILPKYYEIIALKVMMKRGFMRRTILFYPQIPLSRHVLFRIVHVLGYRITNRPIPNPFAIIYYENAATFQSNDETLINLSNKYRIINYKCRDWSKELASSLFEKAFGYKLSINPLVEKGKFVTKSNLNARHDGKVITGPIEKREEGVVYQKLINNQVDDELVCDIRTPVSKGMIPFVYLKYRNINNRFGKKIIKEKIVEVNEVFTEDEMQKIASFCEEMGLDYGELDILRDKEDGRIYIVDANPTPGNLPRRLSTAERKQALKRLALNFEKALLQL